MVTYLDVYNDARRKLCPVDSLYYTIGEAKTNHPSLKQFIGHDNDALIGSINRSARVLLNCIRDIEDFTLSGIQETTVTFVREQFCRAYSHLAHYLGMDVVSKFVSEVTGTPLVELMYGTDPTNTEKFKEWISAIKDNGDGEDGSSHGS